VLGRGGGFPNIISWSAYIYGQRGMDIYSYIADYKVMNRRKTGQIARGCGRKGMRNLSWDIATVAGNSKAWMHKSPM